ncbi:MAG: hypothetical protein Q4E67_00665 [Planctomycetia bacterium]|nr:hypothetical protein [Planctomycetia bacterium]
MKKALISFFLEFLNIGRREAIFVFSLLIAGAVCTGLGFPHGEMLTWKLFRESRLLQVGMGLTAGSLFFYILLMKGGERRLFILCFLFSLFFHLGLISFSHFQVVGTRGDNSQTVALHWEESAPEVVADYYWKEEETEPQPPDFLPDYDPQKRLPLSNQQVQEELEQLRTDTAATEESEEKTRALARELAEQILENLPEPEKVALDVEKMPPEDLPPVELESAELERENPSTLSEQERLAAPEVEISSTQQAMRIPLNLRQEAEKRLRQKTMQPRTLDEDVERKGTEALSGAARQWGETSDTSRKDEETERSEKVRPGTGEEATRAATELAIRRPTEENAEDQTREATVEISMGGDSTGVRKSQGLLDEEYRDFLAGAINGLSEEALRTLARQEEVTGSNLEGENLLELSENVAVFRFLPSATPESSTAATLSDLPSETDLEETEDEAEMFTPATSPRQLSALAESVTLRPTSVAPYRQRMRANHRKMIQEGGGDPETEKVVEQGLTYLSRTQFSDGRWSFDRIPRHMQISPDDVQLGVMNADSGATGLSLLAFLGSGYTHLNDPAAPNEYQETVSRGLAWLLQRQQRDGSLFDPKVDGNRYARIYSHGISSIALCEAFGMTQDSRLREPAQRAIDFIVRAQTKNQGGWRYTPENPNDPWRGESDTSVSGWQLMALVSARMAGLEVPQETLERVKNWLDYAAIDGGSRFCYMPIARPMNAEQEEWRTPSYAMTAEGLLMQLYLGHIPNADKFDEGVTFLGTNLPNVDSARRDTYYWYYATQLMFHVHDERWQKWQQSVVQTLRKNQESSGPLAGSWSPVYPSMDKWGAHGGRHYITTMHLLILEVYYRHLPLFRELIDHKPM